MDRQTLAHYGWIVIVALVLAVMLALATPFGKYVMDGVSSIASGYINASNEAMSEENQDKLVAEWEDKWVNPSVTLENVVIDGVSYQYEPHMTWKEWVNSEYNTANFQIYDDYIVINENGTREFVRYKTMWGIASKGWDYALVKAELNDEIVRNEEYTLADRNMDALSGYLYNGEEFFEETDNDGKVIYEQIRHHYQVD